MTQILDIEQRRLENGLIEIVVSEEGLPCFLTKAKEAIERRDIMTARTLLDERAIATVQSLVHKDPQRVDIMFMMGLMLLRIHKPKDAETWFRQILAQGAHPIAFLQLAEVCCLTERFYEAVEFRHRALGLAADNKEIKIAYALDLMRVCRIEEGLDILRQVVTANPYDADAHSKFIFHMHYVCDPDPQALFEAHKQWGCQHAPLHLARHSHHRVIDPERRLRIGYLSADFYCHSVAYNFEAVLDGHNRDVVELFGYAHVALPDEVTGRLASKFDTYRDIRSLDDQAVVHLMEQDKIDILVAIAGHTQNHRLTVLAYKPAPIQVDFQSINTTGIAQVDYRFTDALLDSPGVDRFYVEESIALPGGILCYTPPPCTPPVVPLPAQRKGWVTFGAFHNIMKINTHVITLWSEVLKACPGARLWIKCKGGADPAMREYLLKQFVAQGVNLDRIWIWGRCSFEKHWQMYNEVDIALDTYPFNGCITTLEALWMGVPTITLVGKTYASRMGLTILHRVEMDYFAAASLEDYVTKAKALTQNLASLAQIRTYLRGRMQNSSLCDVATYTYHLEQAYRMMWHRWCRSQRKTLKVNSAAPQTYEHRFPTGLYGGQ